MWHNKLPKRRNEVLERQRERGVTLRGSIGDRIVDIKFICEERSVSVGIRTTSRTAYCDGSLTGNPKNIAHQKASHSLNYLLSLWKMQIGCQQTAYRTVCGGAQCAQHTHLAAFLWVSSKRVVVLDQKSFPTIFDEYYSANRERSSEKLSVLPRYV